MVGGALAYLDLRPRAGGSLMRAPQPETVKTPPPASRERLVEARCRLVERIAEDWSADRRFPDSGWTRMLADIQLVIAAVDDVAVEDRP